MHRIFDPQHWVDYLENSTPELKAKDLGVVPQSPASLIIGATLGPLLTMNRHYLQMFTYNPFTKGD